MKIVKYGWRTIVFIFLTILTQVGGIVYLISLSINKAIDNRLEKRLFRWPLHFVSFLVLYLIATFLIVPVLAKPFGRVPLPLTASENLQPLNFLTCLLNRHYVRPALKQSTLAVAQQMSIEYPGTVINYLDANFPFINRFPLIPHLSHNDGRKLDLAFCYTDAETGQPTNKVPSCIGYGINEGPVANEENMPGICAEKGHWQYSFLTKIVPQGNKADYSFDKLRTAQLVNLFAADAVIGKIFIEPHLKARLKLTNDKVRFHGCHAVRHDDHIHIQLK